MSRADLDAATAAAPDRCRRCAHLATLTAHGETSITCLRGREISGTCGWWRPRRLSFYESAVLPNATSHRGAACGASGGLPGCTSAAATESE